MHVKMQFYRLSQLKVEIVECGGIVGDVSVSDFKLIQCDVYKWKRIVFCNFIDARRVK